MADQMWGAGWNENDVLEPQFEGRLVVLWQQVLEGSYDFNITAARYAGEPWWLNWWRIFETKSSVKGEIVIKAPESMIRLICSAMSNMWLLLNSPSPLKHIARKYSLSFSDHCSRAANVSATCAASRGCAWQIGLGLETYVIYDKLFFQCQLGSRWIWESGRSWGLVPEALWIASL